MSTSSVSNSSYSFSTNSGSWSSSSASKASSSEELTFEQLKSDFSNTPNYAQDLKVIESLENFNDLLELYDERSALNDYSQEKQLKLFQQVLSLEENSSFQGAFKVFFVGLFDDNDINLKNYSELNELAHPNASNQSVNSSSETSRFEELMNSFKNSPSYSEDLKAIESLNNSKILTKWYNGEVDPTKYLETTLKRFFEQAFSLKANEGLQGAFRGYFVGLLENCDTNFESYGELNKLAHPNASNQSVNNSSEVSRFEELKSSLKNSPSYSEDLKAIESLNNFRILIKWFNRNSVPNKYLGTTLKRFFEQAFLLQTNEGLQGKFRIFFVQQLFTMKVKFSEDQFSELQKLSGVSTSGSSSIRETDGKRGEETPPYWLYAAGIFAIFVVSYPLVLKPAYQTSKKWLEKMRTPKEV